MSPGCERGQEHCGFWQAGLSGHPPPRWGILPSAADVLGCSLGLGMGEGRSKSQETPSSL